MKKHGPAAQATPQATIALEKARAGIYEAMNKIIEATIGEENGRENRSLAPLRR